MALTSVDERELLAPLIGGMAEVPVWDTFLRRLIARTRATQVCLLLRLREASHLPPVLRRVAARPEEPEPDFARLDELGLIPLATMRPGRVYALQETISVDVDDLRLAQRAALAQARMAQARFIRVRSRDGHEAWIVITHQRVDFGGGDSALLSDLAPHLAAALDILALIDGLRLRTAIAEQALGLIGVKQAALDREGRPVATPDAATDASGTRLPLAPRAAGALAGACTALAGQPGSTRQLVRTGEEEGADLLLRPCPDAGTALPTPATAAALSRVPRREDAQRAARLLTETLGLSDREAALAEAISRGQSIVEAGKALRLTPETARNYSKRIYAKTGASGQADLVRMVLTGLAPFA